MAMFTLDIGKLRLTSLDDGSFPFPAHYFFSNVVTSAWQDEVHADAEGKIMVGHNCALVDTGTERILLDTGYGDDTHAGRTGHLLDELGRFGCGRPAVTMVVNTHPHGDHAGRDTMMVEGRREPAFPHARYFLARADWEYFKGHAGELHHFGRNFGVLAERGILTLFDGPLQLAPGVSLLPTPGHTPGHVSVLVESQGRTALYLGDVCHHPLHFAHPGWISSFDTDPGQTPRTRAWLFAMLAERDALVLCPHAPAPGLGKVVRVDSRAGFDEAQASTVVSIPCRWKWKPDGTTC
jgi:glyoxylase-like metal-dependent hydrolase (beta-lactamase superfamily II)